MNNCTFSDLINQNGYFVAYDAAPGKLDISNCIFGNTIDPASSNWIKSSLKASVDNCYATSDCVFKSNSIPAEVAVYQGTAADLFADPATGDFTIKDNSFAGKSSAGDLRWR